MISHSVSLMRGVIFIIVLSCASNVNKSFGEESDYGLRQVDRVVVARDDPAVEIE